MLLLCSAKHLYCLVDSSYTFYSSLLSFHFPFCALLSSVRPVHFSPKFISILCILLLCVCKLPTRVLTQVYVNTYISPLFPLPNSRFYQNCNVPSENVLHSFQFFIPTFKTFYSELRLVFHSFIHLVFLSPLLYDLFVPASLINHLPLPSSQSSSHLAYSSSSSS